MIKESGIVERLRFDAARCELQFSKGVASNIEAAATLIAELQADLAEANRRYFAENPYAEHNKILEARALAAESRLAAAWEALAAAETYYNGYCQDEADERENCISDEQHTDAINFRDKLAAIRAAGENRDERKNSS